ncbi:MAG: chlorite dismutase family protein [Egibacteraceae bacterium]
MSTLSGPSVVPSEGWGVLHLFFHLRRELVEDPAHAAEDFCKRIASFEAVPPYQALTFSVLGQKADLGMMLLGPDLGVLDTLSIELSRSPLGAGLLPSASYVSLTELSEYTATREDEARRLVAEEGLASGSAEHATALAAFDERMAAYLEHRLHPRLPRRPVLSFYPMSKRRGERENWYLLPLDERKRLMSGHARLGRSYRGRVLQLITTSVGFDDWEWGVTLLADDPKAISDIVYEMRFDEVSARYAEFGPFVTGLVMPPDQLMARLGLT